MGYPVDFYLIERTNYTNMNGYRRCILFACSLSLHQHLDPYGNGSLCYLQIASSQHPDRLWS